MVYIYIYIYILLTSKPTRRRPRRGWEDNIRKDIVQIVVNPRTWIELLSLEIIGEPF